MPADCPCPSHRLWCSEESCPRNAELVAQEEKAERERVPYGFKIVVPPYRWAK